MSVAAAAVAPQPRGDAGVQGGELQCDTPVAVSALASRQRKARPLVREVRVELQGQLGSVVLQTLMECLRQYRHRYAPLMRCYFTAVDGPTETLARSTAGFLPVAPATAVGHSLASGCLTFDRTIALDDFCGDNNDAPAALERFMTHFFLSGAVHRTWEDAQTLAVPATSVDDLRGTSAAFSNARSWMEQSARVEREGPVTTESPDEWPLYLRHYVEEGSRTASFLIANKKTRRAIAIDPDWVVSRIEADLERFQLTLVAVALTHCHLDVRTGHAELLRRHPTAELVWYGSFVTTSITEQRCREPQPLPSLFSSGEGSDDGGHGRADPDADVGDGDVHSLPISLGGGLSVTGRWTPIATMDSVTIELWFDRNLLNDVDCGDSLRSTRPVRLCVFGGISFSLDGLPRSDLYELTQANAATPVTALRSAATVVSSEGPLIGDGAQTTISAASRRRFAAMCCWFAEYFGGTFNSVPEKDCTIVFSSHGGYSHMTHQLDQHWAAHIGDLKRFTHVKKMLESLAVLPKMAGMSAEVRGAGHEAPFLDPESEKAALALQILDASLPPLPIGGLFIANRARNMAEAVEATTAISSLKGLTSTPLSLRPLSRFSSSSSSSSPSSPASSSSSSLSDAMLIIDVRPIDEFIKSHWHGSVNVPMTFPSTVRRTRKAELWLECLLPLPPWPSSAAAGDAAVQAIDGTSPASANSCDARPQRRIVVVIGGSCGGDAQSVRDRFARIGCCDIDLVVYKPEDDVEMRAHWRRLSDTPSLRLLETGTGGSGVCARRSQREVGCASLSLVIDVRTHYEFKNGSHRASVHVPLSDLCAWFRDSLSLSPVERAHALLNRLRDAAMGSSGIPPFRRADLRQLVFYCAAGYRSHIAVSIIHSVLDAARRALVRNGGATVDNVSCRSSSWQIETLEVLDVAGGALQIMLHRPDVWVVKDRSIVCIS